MQSIENKENAQFKVTVKSKEKEPRLPVDFKEDSPVKDEMDEVEEIDDRLERL